VVTAHLDEIALMVTAVPRDGVLPVAPLGGAHPWKWGEGPVELLATNAGRTTHLPGVLSFGSIHTTSPLSAAQQARDGHALTWSSASVLTGLPGPDLWGVGVRPGTRVVLARQRRTVWTLGGGLVASYFLDDRADLVAWLLALDELRREPPPGRVLFAATTSEEVGGQGAQFLLSELRPAVCIALEIGPTTPDAPFPIDANPTVWVSDTYAATSPFDLDMIATVAEEIGLSPHFHAVTRGGSDASCAASRGLCARPVTLAFAADNSHGFEVMHGDAPANLARMLVASLRRVAETV
jgi:putative aminopeptidase FrvX